MCLEGVQELIALDGPVLNEAALGAHQDIRLINLVHVCGSALVLESLNDILAAGLQVDDRK